VTSGGHDDEDDLISRIAAGDRTSLRQLMARHASRMLKLGERVTGNAADADEIVQETFVKVWRMAPDWQAEGAAKFSTWLHRVVLNAAIDRTRRRQHMPLDEMGLGDEMARTPDAFDQMRAQQRQALIAQAMQDLPLRQRRALSLFYFAEMRTAEAAKTMDASLSATEALLVRGKTALKTALRRRGIKTWEDV
jgi:RNA polymerase sigma-70 factor, ECF subfamily